MKSEDDKKKEREKADQKWRKNAEVPALTRGQRLRRQLNPAQVRMATYEELQAACGDEKAEVGAYIPVDES